MNSSNLRLATRCGQIFAQCNAGVHPAPGRRRFSALRARRFPADVKLRYDLKSGEVLSLARFRAQGFTLAGWLSHIPDASQ